MLDVNAFSCTVRGFSPTDDGSSYKYHLHLQYAGGKWEVHKRFSDFDLLLVQLHDANYAALPSLPEKTFLGSPSDVETITQRQRQLEIILHALIARPDIRCSFIVRQFLSLDSHCNVAQQKLQPTLVRGLEDLRFGVSDFVGCVEDGVLVVTQEDSTALSRLGRVWSVVEPDELGSLHVWVKAADKAWEREYSETFALKARCVAYAKKSKRIFVGMEDGIVRVYARNPEVAVDKRISLVGELDLHHRAPVTHLSVDDERLMSLGYDTAVRVVSLETLQVISGGRLAKRLGDAYLTSGLFVKDCVVLGSSEDDLFVYNIAGNPPGFRSQAKVMSGGPINEIIAFGNSLLVAHGDRISHYPSPDPQTGQLCRTAEFRTPHLQMPEYSLMSCHSADKLILGAYNNGAVIGWSISEQEPLFALRTHEEGCRRIRWQPPPWGPAFMTGGMDGKVLTWSMPLDVAQYSVWRPAPPVDQVGETTATVIGKPQSTRQDGWIDPSSEGQAEKPVARKPEQKLISSFTHHTGDSDEDDELTGIF